MPYAGNHVNPNISDTEWLGLSDDRYVTTSPIPNVQYGAGMPHRIEPNGFPQPLSGVADWLGAAAAVAALFDPRRNP